MYGLPVKLVISLASEKHLDVYRVYKFTLRHPSVQARTAPFDLANVGFHVRATCENRTENRRIPCCRQSFIRVFPPFPKFPVENAKSASYCGRVRGGLPWNCRASNRTASRWWNP